jgi:hypothetical protein
MSVLKIRAALETALAALTPALPTAWENIPFEPVTGQAYQQAFVQLAEPENIEYGGVYEQAGIFQINLRYPTKTGTADSTSRAEMIADLFKKGASFQSIGLIVTIYKPTHIGKGAVVEDRWLVPVRVFFHSHILS